MIVNGIDIKTYGASVSKKLIYPSEIEINKSKVKNICNQLSSKVKLKKINIKILFEAVNREDAYNNISKFIANFIDEADIKFKNLPNYYHVYLTNSSVEDTDFDEWLYLNIECDAYEYGTEIIENMDHVTTKNVNIKGTSETPCIVEITPDIDLISITLRGFSEDPIVIKNLKANKKIILDGELGKITVNGVNKFSDTDLWQYPSFKNGKTNLVVDKATCNIQIKYKPRYI